MVQLTLTPVSSIHTGSHEHPTVRHIAFGCSLHLRSAHGSLGQSPEQEKLVTLNWVTFGLPQSTMSPVSLKKTGTSSPQREKTAQVALGWLGQLRGLHGLAARIGSTIWSHSTPPYPPQQSKVVLFCSLWVKES